MNVVRRQIALAVLIAASAPRTWSQTPAQAPNLAATPAGYWLQFLRPQTDLSRVALDGYQRSMRDLEAFINQQRTMTVVYDEYSILILDPYAVH
ncbi:hypothetical protein MRX96_059412 [Rhipicephalus microplus]